MADDGNCVSRRDQLHAAVAKLKEEHQHRGNQLRADLAQLKKKQRYADDLEAARLRAQGLPPHQIVAALFPSDPDSEQLLRLLIARVLAIAEARFPPLPNPTSDAPIPDELKEPITAHNTGRVIVETAAENLRVATGDFFFAKSHEEHISACYRIVEAVYRIAPFGVITIEAQLALEREQARAARAAKAKKRQKRRLPDEQDILIQTAASQLRQAGITVTAKAIQRLMPEGKKLAVPTINRRRQNLPK